MSKYYLLRAAIDAPDLGGETRWDIIMQAHSDCTFIAAIVEEVCKPSYERKYVYCIQYEKDNVQYQICQIGKFDWEKSKELEKNNLAKMGAEFKEIIDGILQGKNVESK